MARYFSDVEANHALDRLRASVGFDQEVTLRPDEAYLILKVVERLAYAAGGRTPPIRG